MFYRLVDKKPVPCKTGLEWAEWYEAAAVSEERIVARDELDGLLISTIFIGIDPGAGDSDEPPLLFETMTFVNGKATGIAIRSATWEDAEDRHRSMIRQIHKSNDDDDA
jgi:hypothetical protein